MTLHLVQLYAKINLFNESFQFDFSFSVSVVSICMSVRLKRSTWPFPSGWYGVVREPSTPEVYFSCARSWF